LKAAAAGLLLIVLAAPGLSAAQESPSEVSDAEIARYKATVQKICRDASMARGDPQVQTDAFCNCMLGTLEKSMKRPEWQQAYFYSLKNRESDEQQVVAPHLGRLEACRPKG
jgi:hypothetical protein